MSHSESLFEGDDADDTVKSFSRRDFIRVIFKHLGTIALTWVAATIALVWGLWYIPLTYTADAKILVKASENPVPSFFSDIAPIRERPDVDPINRILETEMELIEARTLSERVVHDQKITYGQVYRVPYKVLLDPVMQAYDYLMQKVLKLPEDPQKRGEAATVEIFTRAIKVAPLKSKSADTNSNIFSVQLKMNDPQLVQRALDQLTREYVSLQTQVNVQKTDEALRIVSIDLKSAEDGVHKAREKLRVFQSNGQGQRALSAVKRDPGGPIITTPRDLTSVDRLKAMLIERRDELRDVKARFSADNNRVKLLEENVADLEKQIANEVAMVASNETEIAALDRDVAAAESRFNRLQKKLDEIKFYKAMVDAEAQEPKLSNRVIIEPPLVPRDSDRPLRILIGIGGSLASILVGIALAGLLEYFDHTLTTRSAVKKALGLEVLAIMPNLSSRRKRQLTDPTIP